MIVYGFVEDDRERGEAAPDRKFVFPAESLDLHEAQSKLGASYNFWLPWGEADGPQQQVSLIARFTPKHGSVVVGEQTTHTLPGKRPTEDLAAADPSNNYTYPVQQAASSPLRPDNFGNMTTTTIPLSTQMSQNLPQATLRPTQAVVTTGSPPATASAGFKARHSPVWQGSTGLRSAGSQLGRSRPLGEPIARLDRERGPWRPGPSIPRYDPAQAPEQGPPR
jgi:hypothetical protein